MTGFLDEVGRRLAERWVALLAVPGLLYVAAVTVTVALGQQHAVDVSALGRRITAWAGGAALRSPGGAILFAVAVLAGSVGAGLTASVLGRAAERAWFAVGRRWPGRLLTGWRQARAREAKRVADDPASSRALAGRAMERADRICLVEPARPTWIGDRLRVTEVRAELAYGLDLAAAWPRLWLMVPDGVRGEIGTAGESLAAAAQLAGWAVLYAVLGLWWWPAAPIALITAITCAIRARAAAGVLADLVESAVDLHSRQLAVQLGAPVTGQLTPAEGAKLTTLMRKSRWDPASPTAQ
ncbi:MAG TPA: hypothetical protein VNF47_10795 [Streptosporangiaceae bacterium]|nr:hypothetical protein [Streptosporangiaceae bacterium]